MKNAIAGVSILLCLTNCVSIALIRQPPRLGVATLIPAVHLLQRSERPRPGIGLYTYVLFPRLSQSDPTMLREILLNIAYSAGGADRYYRTRPLESLNVIFIPVKSPVPGGWSIDTVDAVIKAYDFDRAEELLLLCDTAYDAGPTIVSSLKPMWKGAQLPSPPLIQDFKRVTSDTRAMWVRLFIYRASRPSEWDNVTLHEVFLEIRDVLGTVAKAGEPVADAINSMIRWGKELLDE